MRAILLLAVVAACGLPHVAHADIIQAGLQPGEAFTYRFSVGPIEGARARMSIGEPVVRDGHPLLAVQGEAETVSLVNLVAPVNANYKLILDASTLLPQEVTTVERGLHERSYHSTLTGRTIDLEVVAPNRSIKSKRTLPREVRDPLSAFFALRASRLADGVKLEFDVIDGAALWRTHLRVVGREWIRLNEESPTPGPKTRAIRIEGKLDRIDDQGHVFARVPARTVVCWLTDDPSRALLRASFDSTLGRALLELTRYIPPAKPHGMRPASLPGLTVD